MAIVEDHRPAGAGADPEALFPEARELQRTRLRRRAGAALVALLLAAAGGIVLFGGGGAHAGLDLNGPLPAGIAARVPDPDGGLPWGIRVVHSTDWTCVQLGRLRGNQLGLIARDGLAGNTGRFYPFGPSTRYQARCAQNDGNGHAFMTVELGAQPASGAGGGYTGMSPCEPAVEVAGFRRAVARLERAGPGAASATLKPPPVCPARDLRFIQYGLLGPDATSITYTLGGPRVVERTHGEDGAFLVVGPATPAFCAHLGRGSMCGGPGDAPESIGAGMIGAVSYRDAPSCRLDRPTGRLPGAFDKCPLVGFVAPTPPLSASQVAAPVTFHVIRAKRYCLTGGTGARYGFGSATAVDLGPYRPCSGTRPPGADRRGDVIAGTMIIFSWTARRAVTSSNSQYEFVVRTRLCGGQGGSTYGRITAGERLTRAVIIAPGICRKVTGAVGYDPDLGPGGGQDGPEEPGRGGSLVVGRFTATIG